MSLINTCKFVINAVNTQGWMLAAAKAELKKSADITVKARSKVEFVNKVKAVMEAEEKRLAAAGDANAQLEPSLPLCEEIARIAQSAYRIVDKIRTAKLLVNHELNCVDKSDRPASDKVTLRGTFEPFLACVDYISAAKALTEIETKARDLLFMDRVRDGFFVAINHYPAAGTFHYGNAQFAGSPCFTRVFATRDAAQAWADDLMEPYSLPMVVPAQLLASFFNDANHKELEAGEWQMSAEEVKAALLKDGIAPEDIELRKFIETPAVYTRMQLENLERDDAFHHEITYCAVQVYVNGQYKFDVAHTCRWRSAFEIHAELEQALRGAQPVNPDAEPAAAAEPKRKLVARATEETKGEGEERNGRIMMSIEGPRDFIEWAEKDLAQVYESAQCEGEGKNEGEIGLYFGLDRDDKPLFMARWKQLKAAWLRGEDYPQP